MNNRIAINIIKSYTCSTQTPNNTYLVSTLIPKVKGVCDESILEPIPTHIITSPLTSLCLFCNSHFELLISNWTSIKYWGVAINTSKVHINNMYIKYTFVHFGILLIRQILGVVLLPLTSPFVVEALSLRLRSRLGLLHLSSNLLAVLLEVPLITFALFLKLVVFSTNNTWCFSWFLPP